MAGAGGFLAQLDNSANVPIQRMFSVGLVKMVETMRPRSNESQRPELAQFVLNRVEGEMTFQHQFTNVILSRRCREEQPKELCPDGWKQNLQNRPLRFQGTPILVLTA
jgi:hypothetical protein